MWTTYQLTRHFPITASQFPNGNPADPQSVVSLKDEFLKVSGADK